MVSILETIYAPHNIETNIEPTEIGQFNFKGLANRYLSEYSLIGGAYPMEQGDGNIRIRDAFQQAAPLRISEQTHSVRIVSF